MWPFSTATHRRGGQDRKKLRMTDKQLTATHVIALLNKEFARLKSPECTQCHAPVPFWGPAPNDTRGYWYLPTPQACSHGCSKVMLELWARVNDEYRILPPGKEHVEWLRGVRVMEPHG